jgi:3',5'-cyclic AMP phosphodiesterase CpdA
MQRRTFIKLLGVGAAVPGVVRSALQDSPAELPPYARVLPSTPFESPVGSWTLVVLPDTQDMAQHFPAAFIRQTEWIVAHRERHDIRFVVHEGDITNNNAPAEWENAREAMSRLSSAGIPYALLPGNHDLGIGGKAADRSTLLNDYFDSNDYRHSRSVGYFESGRMENSWHKFVTPLGEFLIVALEFGPRDEVLEWADGVIRRHPEHRVIVVTHAYLYSDSTRYDLDRHGTAQRWNPRSYPLHTKGISSVNDAEQLWQKLVRKHKNIQFVLSGHVLNDGAGYLLSTGDHRQKIHQILANYQAAVVPRRPYGGGAFLRLMQFLPDGKTVQVRSYSPWLDSWLTEPEQQYLIDLTA